MVKSKWPSASSTALATTPYRMHLAAVSPGFLEALGCRVLAGRTLEPRDAAADWPVVVISRTVARELFDGADAVGRELPSRGLGKDPRHPRVIGVVDDVRYSGLAVAAGGAIYMPWSQLPLGVVSLVVRSSGDPRSLLPGIRKTLQEMDPSMAIEAPRPLDELAAGSVAERRLQVEVGAAFALLTLALATCGLVASLMRLVDERRHRARNPCRSRRVTPAAPWPGPRLRHATRPRRVGDRRSRRLCHDRPVAAGTLCDRADGSFDLRRRQRRGPGRLCWRLRRTRDPCQSRRPGLIAPVVTSARGW